MFAINQSDSTNVLHLWHMICNLQNPCCKWKYLCNNLNIYIHCTIFIKWLFCGIAFLIWIAAWFWWWFNPMWTSHFVQFQFSFAHNYLILYITVLRYLVFPSLPLTSLCFSLSPACFLIHPCPIYVFLPSQCVLLFSLSSSLPFLLHFPG